MQVMNGFPRKNPGAIHNQSFKLQLLYLRNTGKSTFLNFLKALFQNNVTFKDHQKNMVDS